MTKLIAWKNSPRRKPLILQGVRQCGKTFILNRFGQENYSRTVYFNFEMQPQLCSIFERGHDTTRIIRELSVYHGALIQPEDSLLILDEIQFCPKAITSLKYFCENSAEYHIATAGSLLGIQLTDSPKIELIWHSIPSQLARPKSKFIYKTVTDGARARDYENALQWLINAGMITKVTHLAQPGMPLSAYEDPHHFKILAADIGLLRRLARLPAGSIILGDRLYTEFRGAMAENLFAQEMLAYGIDDLHFWTSGNTAEVDFVLLNGSRIVPVEIKSADNARAKSLQVYSGKYDPEIKVRVSMKEYAYSKDQKLLSLPPYLLFNFRNLTQKFFDLPS